MQYLFTFLEGFISFISPCMLPMLPVYLSYFAPSAQAEEVQKSTLPRAACFVCGFTAVFCLLGLFAGTLGAFLQQYRTVVQIICGLVVVVFGLSYLEIIPLPFFKGMTAAKKVNSLFGAFVFGAVYSISLTPCVGAFLGSALMLAATSGGAGTGFLLLLVYSMGLGIPFLVSAVLIGKLTGAFALIKKHYKLINTVCGLFLIAVGVLMATGLLHQMLNVLR